MPRQPAAVICRNRLSGRKGSTQKSAQRNSGFSVVYGIRQNQVESYSVNHKKSTSGYCSLITPVSVNPNPPSGSLSPITGIPGFIPGWFGIPGILNGRSPIIPIYPDIIPPSTDVVTRHPYLTCCRGPGNDDNPSGPRYLGCDRS